MPQQAPWRSILERVVKGALVHADETKVHVGGRDGHVWVFTNLEDVAFVYSESRDATTPQTILTNFNGVLISDFFAAYDSIPCAQQRCLVHLMRDLNEALSKQPFNEEMKELTQSFANILKPMIDTLYLYTHPRRLIPLSQVDQYLGLAGGIRNGAAFDFFGGS